VHKRTRRRHLIPLTFAHVLAAAERTGEPPRIRGGCLV
jgi:hypothetical protein